MRKFQRGTNGAKYRLENCFISNLNTLAHEKAVHTLVKISFPVGRGAGQLLWFKMVSQLVEKPEVLLRSNTMSQEGSFSSSVAAMQKPFHMGGGAYQRKN